MEIINDCVEDSGDDGEGRRRQVVERDEEGTAEWLVTDEAEQRR